MTAHCVASHVSQMIEGDGSEAIPTLRDAVCDAIANSSFGRAPGSWHVKCTASIAPREAVGKERGDEAGDHAKYGEDDCRRDKATLHKCHAHGLSMPALARPTNNWLCTRRGHGCPHNALGRRQQTWPGACKLYVPGQVPHDYLFQAAGQWKNMQTQGDAARHLRFRLRHAARGMQGLRACGVLVPTVKKMTTLETTARAS